LIIDLVTVVIHHHQQHHPDFTLAMFIAPCTVTYVSVICFSNSVRSMVDSKKNEEEDFSFPDAAFAALLPQLLVLGRLPESVQTCSNGTLAGGRQEGQSGR
jgi:hypothetical protein